MLEFIKITDFPRGTLYDILKDAYSYDSRNNTAKEYVDLLGTYSDHIAIDEFIRTSFFKDIEKIINSFGGVIRIYDTMDLQLARKVK